MLIIVNSDSSSSAPDLPIFHVEQRSYEAEAEYVKLSSALINRDFKP